MITLRCTTQCSLKVSRFPNVDCELPLKKLLRASESVVVLEGVLSRRYTSLVAVMPPYTVLLPYRLARLDRLVLGYGGASGRSVWFVRLIRSRAVWSVSILDRRTSVSTETPNSDDDTVFPSVTDTSSGYSVSMLSPSWLLPFAVHPASRTLPYNVRKFLRFILRQKSLRRKEFPRILTYIPNLLRLSFISLTSMTGFSSSSSKAVTSSPAVSLLSLSIRIEQNSGPHIEQNSDSL